MFSWTTPLVMGAVYLTGLILTFRSVAKGEIKNGKSRDEAISTAYAVAPFWFITVPVLCLVAVYAVVHRLITLGLPESEAERQAAHEQAEKEREALEREVLDPSVDALLERLDAELGQPDPAVVEERPELTRQLRDEQERVRAYWEAMPRDARCANCRGLITKADGWMGYVHIPGVGQRSPCSDPQVPWVLTPEGSAERKKFVFERRRNVYRMTVMDSTSAIEKLHGQIQLHRMAHSGKFNDCPMCHDPSWPRLTS